MHKKALTVAIAGALAVPMAAQAVDFTISGQVNRALFITDTDGGTSAEVANNLDWSTRIRANGRSELEGGGNVRIQFEYEESGSGVNLRHANVQYGGDFGRVTLGQGSEAGDGSQYLATTGVNGIGHGAGTSSDFTLGDWFGDLDGGGRIHMIRYDTPAIGPVSAAVSVGNDDKVSARLGLNTEVAGSSFAAQLATQRTGGGASNISASFGSTLASGLTVSGAWAKGSDMAVVTEAVEPIYADVWTSTYVVDDDASSRMKETVYRIAVVKDGETSYVFSQRATIPNHNADDEVEMLTDDATGKMLGAGYTYKEDGAAATTFEPMVETLQATIKTGAATGATAGC